MRRRDYHGAPGTIVIGLPLERRGIALGIAIGLVSGISFGRKSPARHRVRRNVHRSECPQNRHLYSFPGLMENSLLDRLYDQFVRSSAISPCCCLLLTSISSSYPFARGRWYPFHPVAWDDCVSSRSPACAATRCLCRMRSGRGRKGNERLNHRVSKPEQSRVARA